MHVVLPVVAVLVGIVVVVLTEDVRAFTMDTVEAASRGASSLKRGGFVLLYTQPTHRFTHTPHRSASEGPGVAGLVQPLGPQDHSYAGEIWNLKRPKVRARQVHTFEWGKFMPSLPS